MNLLFLRMYILESHTRYYWTSEYSPPQGTGVFWPIFIKVEMCSLISLYASDIMNLNIAELMLWQ